MKKSKEIVKKLDYILSLLESRVITGIKEVLNIDDLQEYTGFKKSYIYKLVHTNAIPFSKPNGKLLYFQKSEIDQWLIKNKSLSGDSIKEKTQNYTLKKIEK
ncbi:prophage regulatory protein [Myroides gitamensis]|uniref:helix-turn-helix transcriptional regulator n=1 Tax=Myroides odoratus TaxID=256 RepID=UPI00216953B9|nr:helix-turn-helix domain-containing protein [Myroides odoratus]MCS4238691.1 excisionase family DNA binding protein [Myroides odoratus]MDH6600374.1 prophage regulatory protein [Myroides gitamensis]